MDSMLQETCEVSEIWGLSSGTRRKEKQIIFSIVLSFLDVEYHSFYLKAKV
jgi:hypothetical protein